MILSLNRIGQTSKHFIESYEKCFLMYFYLLSDMQSVFSDIKEINFDENAETIQEVEKNEEYS